MRYPLMHYGVANPRPATGVSRAVRARSVPRVSLRVSPQRGCPKECPTLSLGPFGPRAPECPKSVLRVSSECEKGVLDSPGTLSGHFLDTQSDTPPPPVFGDTPGTLQARRAQETPVAGRGVRNYEAQSDCTRMFTIWEKDYESANRALVIVL